MSYTILYNVRYQCAAFPCIRSDDATMLEYSVHWISLLVPRGSSQARQQISARKARLTEGKPKVVVKIPQRVFQNCVGLAIFTVMRSGFSISTAGGSGVVIARKEDGDWSPPSGIHVQTLGLGFMVGIDIYDCIVVINSYEALKSFNRFRFTLGGEMSAVAGPIGVGGLLEIELSETHKPLWTYMKSRGIYCGLQLDTTIVIERYNENARFYGKKISIEEIFAGQVTNVPLQAKMLMEAARRAEGRV
ncbi:unnamed protein product [Alternaria alternata]